MGRLMLSLQLLDAVNADERPDAQPKIEPADDDCESLISTPIATVPKWSASNAFDPDSEEFWNRDDVVYEAFVDGDSLSSTPVDSDEQQEREGEGDVERGERERLLEEETNSLVASGNESRRRRRENAWIAFEMDRVVTPLPAPDYEGTGERTPGAQGLQDTRRRLLERAAAAIPPPAAQPVAPEQSQSQNLSVGMISDVSHRTASPIPYLNYGDVSVYIPSLHHTNSSTNTNTHTPQSRHRRRESQPAPISSTLLFT